MSTKTSELMSAGCVPDLAKLLAVGLDESATGITAAGTTITDATQLTKPITVVGTTASGTGVKLSKRFAGALIIIKNSGAETLTIFPHVSGATINGSASVTLATTKSALLFAVSETAYHSIGLD